MELKRTWQFGLIVTKLNKNEIEKDIETKNNMSDIFKKKI